MGVPVARAVVEDVAEAHGDGGHAVGHEAVLAVVHRDVLDDDVVRAGGGAEGGSVQRGVAAVGQLEMLDQPVASPGELEDGPRNRAAAGEVETGGVEHRSSAREAAEHDGRRGASRGRELAGVVVRAGIDLDDVPRPERRPSPPARRARVYVREGRPDRWWPGRGPEPRGKAPRSRIAATPRLDGARRSARCGPTDHSLPVVHPALRHAPWERPPLPDAASPRAHP